MKRTAIIIFIAFLLPGCKDDDPAVPAPLPPVITSISPTSGPFDTQVTISGSGFFSTPASNEVTINGKTAEVISATETALVFKVPARAGSGEVSVSTIVGATTGPDFNYTYTVNVSTLAGQVGQSGYVDGDPSVSRFKLITEIKVGPDENIYVSDRSCHCIRKITPAGITSTYTGQDSNPGIINGDISVATINGPNGLSYDKNGTAYLTEVGNSVIRKITTGGIVSVFSGAGPPGGYLDGTAALSKYNFPEECAIDQDLNVYVTEFNNHTIRKLDPSGNSVTLAGNGTSGFADGTGIVARFTTPIGIAMTDSQDLIVADWGNNRIRKVSRLGLVTTIAGDGNTGFVDGSALAARFSAPRDVAIDADGNIYILDQVNQAIRLLTTKGSVVTLAGNGTVGSANGSGSSAQFSYPSALALDANGVIYIADTQNFLVRKVVVQ